MNFDDFALGWREALLGAVALLVLYVAIVFHRLRRLRQTPPAVPAAAETPPPVDQPAIPAERLAAAYAETDFPWNEPPEAPADALRLAAVEGDLNRLRSEMTSLHKEVASVSEAIASLREDVRQGLDRVSEHVQAAQHVAPIYGDAMQMALAGHDAASIAERCGVARAEAELVVALIRNRQDDDADPGNQSTQSSMRER